MKRLQLIWIIAFNLILINSAYSQAERKITVTGIVYNIETFDSLPHSEILINKKLRLISDETGFFHARVSITDTLTFIHLGFITTEILISELSTNHDNLFINVLMTEQTYTIPEVSIFPYRTYGQFIRSIVNKDIGNQKLTNAYTNFKIIDNQIKNGYFTANDGKTNFTYLNIYKNTASNSLVLYSSKSDRGLIPAIKKMLHR